MKTKMKQYEAWALEASEFLNHKGKWDSYCSFKDGFFAGFHKARIEGTNRVCGCCDNDTYIDKMGDEEVQVELAGNQIGAGKDL